MTREEILYKVKKITKNVLPDIDVDNIKMSSHFRNDLGLDSIDAMSLIIALENEFDIVIPDIRVKEMTTIEQVVNILEDYIKDVC